MNLLFSFILLCFSHAAGGTITDCGGSVLYRISASGTVTTPENETIGYFKDDGKIENARFQTMGYIEGTKIEDSRYVVIGYFDGANITDANYRKLGYIEADGTVRDNGGACLGHGPASGKEYSAVLFFFKGIL